MPKVWTLNRLITSGTSLVRYFGHIKRQNNSIERLFTEGKQSGERPKTRWSDTHSPMDAN